MDHSNVMLIYSLSLSKFGQINPLHSLFAFVYVTDQILLSAIPSTTCVSIDHINETVHYSPKKKPDSFS